MLVAFIHDDNEIEKGTPIKHRDVNAASIYSYVNTDRRQRIVKFFIIVEI